MHFLSEASENNYITWFFIFTICVHISLTLSILNIGNNKYHVQCSESVKDSPFNGKSQLVTDLNAQFKKKEI